MTDCNFIPLIIIAVILIAAFYLLWQNPLISGDQTTESFVPYYGYGYRYPYHRGYYGYYGYPYRSGYGRYWNYYYPGYAGYTGYAGYPGYTGYYSPYAYSYV